MRPLLVALALLTASGQAMADCDAELYDPTPATVPAFSYAATVALAEEGPFAACSRDAEFYACAEGEEGLTCAADMQRLYVRCVGHIVCGGWTAPDYSECVTRVRYAGGLY